MLSLRQWNVTFHALIRRVCQARLNHSVDSFDHQDPVFSAFPEIETERLLLREIMPEDASAILRIFGDPEVTRYYDLDTYNTMDQAKELIDFFDESFELERAVRWGIALKESDELIGTCGYVWIRQFRGEIGYDLAREHWRKGYMSEALEAILEFGFDSLGLNRVEALVMTDNAASSGLLRSLGFMEEGVLRQHDFFKDEFHDMRLFSLLREEFYED
jgi:ribosomal-protein-alanine N-acetyltransferase